MDDLRDPSMVIIFLLFLIVKIQEKNNAIIFHPVYDTPSTVPKYKRSIDTSEYSVHTVL